jgi:hypothetical protein
LYHDDEVVAAGVAVLESAGHQDQSVGTVLSEAHDGRHVAASSLLPSALSVLTAPPYRRIAPGRRSWSLGGVSPARCQVAVASLEQAVQAVADEAEGE